MAAEMESEMWGGSKSGSAVQMAMTPKSIWSTICGISPRVPVLDVRLAMNQLIRLREPRDLGVFGVSGQFLPISVLPLNEADHYLDFGESQSCKDLSGERRTWQSSSRALTGTRATRSWRAAPLDKVCPACRAFFLRHSSKGTRMCFYSSF